MKKLLPLLLLCLATGVFAQKIIKTQKASDHSTYVKGDNFEGVIFSEKYLDSFLLHMEGEKFTPDAHYIIMAEKLLRFGLDTIKDVGNQGPFVKRHIKKYLRQYFGYTNAKGEKVICINAFWNDVENKSDSHWLNDIVDVLDGGNSYWRIKINLTTHQLFDFTVNGEA